MAFTCGKPIWKTLSSTMNTNCGVACICHSRGMCFRKNIVYNIQCNECDAMYIGETHRTLRTRMTEHLKPQSHVYRHFMDEHGRVPTSTDEFTFKIIMAAFKDTSHRLCFEKNAIKINKPMINIKYATSQ